MISYKAEKMVFELNNLLSSTFGSSNVFPVQTWDSFQSKNPSQFTKKPLTQSVPFFGALQSTNVLQNDPIPTGHGQNQPIYECHVTTAGRNRVENPKYQVLFDLLLLVENIHIFGINWIISKMHHSIWKNIFVLWANEYLERLEGKIRKCLIFYVRIF